MRSVASRILLCAALAVALAAPGAVAQEEPGDLAVGYTLRVQPGHEAEFEAAMKKQVEWYQANGETWHWHVWQSVTGPDVGSYGFRSGGHHWEDMDARSERAARARANFQQVVGPHLAGIEGGISRILRKVSKWPDDYGDIPMVSIVEFKLHFGKNEQFSHVLKRIHEVVTHDDWPVDRAFAWATRVSGGEGSTYWLIIPRKSWADMAPEETPFWTNVEKLIGRQETEAIRADFRGCVKESHSWISAYRDDLSYHPPEE